MTPFSEKVIKAIRAIPPGRVATYGQIAKLAGNPYGARGVSWLLHSSSVAHDLPWHRVVNSKGKISFPRLSRSFARQRRRLEAEGILLDECDSIDLKKNQWKRSRKF